MNKFPEIDTRYDEVLRSQNGGFCISFLLGWLDRNLST